MNESLKAFKSLEANQFVISAHVKQLWFRCHLIGAKWSLAASLKGKQLVHRLSSLKKTNGTLKIVLHDIRYKLIKL